MAIPNIPRLVILTARLALIAVASTTNEVQLVGTIDAHRGRIQPCGGQASGELPPLATDPRLALSVNAVGNL